MGGADTAHPRELERFVFVTSANHSSLTKLVLDVKNGLADAKIYFSSSLCFGSLPKQDWNVKSVQLGVSAASPCDNKTHAALVRRVSGKEPDRQEGGGEHNVG